MPKALDECVEKLIADPDFKPKDGEDKKSAAYAVCTARMKDSDVQEEKAKEENGRKEWGLKYCMVTA